MVQFRVKALNQLQKPDDLDLLMKVTKMRGWVALATLGAVVLGAIVWSFTGNLPSEVTATGLLSKPQGVTLIDSTVSGQILSVDVTAGQDIKAGQPVAHILLKNGQTEVIRSRWGGNITGVPIDQGNFVKVGQQLIGIERSNVPDNRLLAFLYVNPAKASGIAPGMKVDLNVSSAPSAAFGVLRGRVTSVAEFPSTYQDVFNLLSDQSLAKQFTENGPATLVTVDFIADPSTRSGYKWSTKAGPPYPIHSGVSVEGTVIQGTQHPIKLVFGK